VRTAKIQYFVEIYPVSYVKNLADRRVHIRPKYLTLSNTFRVHTAVLMKTQVLRCGAVLTGQSLPKDRNVDNCSPLYTASHAVQCRARDLREPWVDCKRLYIVLPTVYWVESAVQSTCRRIPLTAGRACRVLPFCPRLYASKPNSLLCSNGNGCCSATHYSRKSQTQSARKLFCTYGRCIEEHQIVLTGQ
jgi:hypothetical protein